MKYSIILPVRNGGVFIKECVQSILAQTEQDFDLIILENCSTDDTIDQLNNIVDPRIKIVPAKKPLSIEENWGRIRDVQKNEFITLIGHDDLLDENYLAVMNSLIARHPQAGLYQAHFRYIDSRGQEIKKCLPMKEIQQPDEVIHNFLTESMDIMGTGFMMRSVDFDAVGGMPSYPSLLFADMELFIELSQKGYLAVASEECFSYRKHAGATTSTSTDLKVFNAFDQFINYLEKLKNSDSSLGNVISRDSDRLLSQYCQGITHKILRTRYSERQTPSVNQVIDRFREYGRRLKGDNSYEPLAFTSIKLGKIIDSNPVTRSLFRLFKKIRRKPVL
jgi:glycosyltransferase involved in cell wall biosynthesis